jgi:cell division protein FtsL
MTPMKGNEYVDKSKLDNQTKKSKSKRPKRKSNATKQTSQTLVQIMNGDFLNKEFVVRNLSYIFFVMFLLILMVSKGYYVNQLATDIRKTEEEVGQLTADYVEAKARLEEETRRTELIEILSPIGLRETVNPTKVIRKKKDK